MTLKRSLAKPLGAPSPHPKNLTQARTTALPAEVIRNKLEASSSKRYRGSFALLSSRGRAMMTYPYHAHHISAQTQTHVYIGAGVIGFLFLTVFGCMIFQYCKNKLRRSTSQNGERRGPETVTANGQQANNDEQDQSAQDFGEHHSTISDDSEEGELRHLTASIGTVTPARYCVVSNSADSAVAVTPVRSYVALDTADRSELPTTDTCSESNFTVGKGNGSASVDGTSENENISETRLVEAAQTKTVDNAKKVHSRDNPDDALTTATEGEDGNFGTDDPNVLASTSGHERLYTQSDTRHSDSSPQGEETEEHPFLQTDAASDVSEYLATLVLDVSSEHSDVTEGDKTHGSSSRGTDDSVQSFESFSRLQDVKAQAEFSPYHIAWSTPLFPQHPSLQPRRPQKTPAAKKLNMDAVGGKPSDRLTEARHEQGVSSTETAKHEGGFSEDPQSTESSEWQGWGFLKPLEAWSRPASAEYCTPRPTFSKEKRGSLGIFPSADENFAEEEQQPLLPYSVAEYRRSLKNIASTVSSGLGPKESMSTEELYADSNSPSPPHSSISQPTSPHSELVASRNPLILVGVSPVRSGLNEEETPQNLPTSGIGDNMDSTLAGLAEITHSSVGKWSASAHAVSWNNGDCQKNVLQDALNNNGKSKAMNDSETQWSRGQSTFPSSMPSSTTPPSCLLSSEADHTSSITTSSSEEMSHCPIDLSPEHLSIESYTTERMDVKRPLPQGSLMKSNSPEPPAQKVIDNFKVPYPVDSADRRSSATYKTGGSGVTTSIPRSRSSTNKPLAPRSLLEPGQSQLRRSRTFDSISSLTPNPQQPMSVSSLSDISVAGSSISRLSLQEPSLTWDNEFTALGRGHDDSLTWEDDPYLS